MGSVDRPDSVNIALEEMYAITYTMSFKKSRLVMRTISATDFRKNMSAEADRLVDDADVTLVTRTGASNFVVMSEADFNSWRETLYLLGSPKNAAHLLDSLRELDAGRGEARELFQPADMDA